MGSAPSTVDQKIEPSSNDSQKFHSNQEKTRAVFEHAPFDHRQVTCFSCNSATVGTRDKPLTICINGPGVIRIGLSESDPNDNPDFHKSPVFEQEDGFGERTSERRMYCDKVTRALFYGEEGEEIEVQQLGNTRQLWIYVMVVYGQPTIRANQGGQPIKWTAYDNSSVTLKNSDREVEVDTSMNRGLCMMSKPVQNVGVYNIKWDMGLKHERMANRVPEYGFFRLGLVSNIKTAAQLDRAALNTASGGQNVSWFTESAVKSSPYSGVIAFSINQTTGALQHNLLVTSVENTALVEEPCIQGNRDLRLVMEMSCGTISVEHCMGKKYSVKQDPGSMLYFEKFTLCPSELELKLEIYKRIKYSARRIQYGSDPCSFVAFFNEHIDVKGMPQVVEVQETHIVQVLDVPTEMERYELEEFFTDPGRCGGGEIKTIEPIPDIPNSWKIHYKHSADAHCVWSRGRFRISEHILRVLPHFYKLEFAINQGKKPVFDTTDLVLDNLDPEKLNFFMKRDVEKEKFEASLKREACAKVIWPFTEDNSIRFQGIARTHQYKKFMSWKDTVRRKVKDLFEKTICSKTMDIDPKVVDQTTEWLENNQDTYGYTFTKDSGSVIVLTIGEENMKKIQHEIESLAPVAERVSKTLREPISNKYIALDSQDRLRAVEEENPNTRFTVDTRNETTVTIKGPADEVQRAHDTILVLANDLVEVTLDLSVAEMRLLAKEQCKAMLRDELKKQKVVSQFWVDNSQLCIWLYDDSMSNAISKQKNIVATCTKSVFKEECVNVPENAVHITKLPHWAEFVNEKEDAYCIVISVFTNPKTKQATVQVKGAARDVKTVKADIESFLQKTGSGTETIRMSRDIVDYIAFLCVDDTHRYCFKTESIGNLKYHTGVIEIKGNIEERDAAKTDLTKASGGVETFWFVISKPWIASVVLEMPALQTIEEDKRCITRSEIGDTLACYGIPSIAVMEKSGAVIQILQGDIKLQTADVVVKAVHPKKLDPADKNPVTEENIVFTDPDDQRCQQVLRVICSKWVDGTSKEETSLKDTVLKVLKMVADKKYTSILFPSLGLCAGCRYPKDKATQYLTEGVSEYLVKNPKCSIREVFLCDRDKDTVNLFTKAFSVCLKSPSPWFVFEHGRPLADNEAAGGELPGTSGRQRPPSASLRSSATRGADKLERDSRMGNLESALMWKNEMARTFMRTSGNISSDEEEEKKLTKFKADLTEIKEETENDLFTDGLPYRIELSQSTCLRICKGSIEDQQTDVIVCPSPMFPELAGAAALAISKRAGEDMRKECRQLGRLEPREVKTTRSGRLTGCKRIYHILNAMDWDRRTGYEDVSYAVSECLMKAHTDRYTSISIPAIGTGGSKFPADQVANAMVTAACTFCGAYTASSLREIRIVVYYGDAMTCKTFEEEVPKILMYQERMIVEELSGRPRKKLSSLKKISQRRSRGRYVAPSSTEGHSPADDVVLVRVTTKTDRKKIKDEFERVIEDEFSTVSLDITALTKENDLSSKETDFMKRLEGKYCIKVEINTKKNKLNLTGLKAKMRKAEPEARRLLEFDFPSWRYDDHLIAMVAETVQWFYDDNGTSVAVDAKSNFEIQKGYLSGQDFKYTNAKDDKTYQVLVQTREEHPVGYPTKIRRLMQGSKVNKGANIPVSWEIAQTNHDTARVVLDMNSQEFADVKAKFLGDGCPANNVLQIERIEDRFKWLQYASKRIELNKNNAKGTINEQLLWHGTDAATVPLIINAGFDRSFNGKNATAYGDGTYFATTSAYSHGYARMDGTGTCRMFLNRVLTGFYTLGVQGMCYLPVRTTHNGMKVLYDSAVNNMGNPSMFIIFHDTQAYPEY